MFPAYAQLLLLAPVAAAVLGLAPLRRWAARAGGGRLRGRIEREFRPAAAAADAAAARDLGRLAAKPAGDDAATLGRRFGRFVERSGLRLTPGQLLAASAGLAVALGAVAGVLGRGPLVAAAAAATGAAAPLLYARGRAKRRDEKLLAQLSDVLDLMARNLRAGHSLPQAIRAVPEHFKDPARSLFARCVVQQDLGLSAEQALRELAAAAGQTEYRIMVMAVLVQSQTGGNLATVCERLAGVIRERFRVRGVVRALTAEGRMQAVTLLALAPAMVGVMTVVKPSYAAEMLAFPWMLAAVAAAQLLGALWIRKVVNVVV